MHEGHELVPMQVFNFQKDADYPASIICETCGTAGDVYIVDGKAYVDVPHAWDTRSTDDEDGTETGLISVSEALLPDELDAIVAGEPIARQAAVALLTSGAATGERMN
jgi:hypothetical protein